MLEQARIPARSLRDQAYQKIKEKILYGDLSQGALVDEKVLQAELEIGRTPVREALNALMLENLIEVVPRKGTYVQRITLEDFISLYQVRSELEPFIVRIATPIISHEMLSAFRMRFSASEPLNASEMAFADDNFHRYLAQSTKNNYLIRMMENIYFQDYRIRLMSTRATPDTTETNRGHLEIIDNMTSGNAADAEKAMRDHVAYSREVAMELNFRDIVYF